MLVKLTTEWVPDPQVVNNAEGEHHAGRATA